MGEPGDVVIDEDTCFFVKDRYPVTDLGSKDLKGFSNPIAVFSVSVREQSAAG